MFTRRLAAPGLAAIAAIALLAACGQSGAPAVSPNPNVKIDPALQDVILGDPNAPVKIVEYGSLACPHCRDFWMQQMPKLKPAYIDTGKANYTFRDLTLGGAAALFRRLGGHRSLRRQGQVLRRRAGLLRQAVRYRRGLGDARRRWPHNGRDRRRRRPVARPGAGLHR